MIARSVDADQRVVAAAGVGLHVEGVAIEKVDRMIGPGQRVIAAAAVAIHDARVAEEVNEGTAVRWSLPPRALSCISSASPQMLASKPPPVSVSSPPRASSDIETASPKTPLFVGRPTFNKIRLGTGP
jgi:hypothetical protein